jgi:hypothetical protein
MVGARAGVVLQYEICRTGNEIQPVRNLGLETPQADN